MKKIFLTIFSISILFSSCQDAVDILQDGELYPDTAYESVDELSLGLNAIYASVGYNSIIELSSVWTDECAKGFANGGQGLSDDLVFVMNSGSGFASSIFSTYYALINRANRLIAAAEGIEPDSEDVDTYNDILAQTRALRAFAYFQLETYFSEDITDDSALGVMLFDYVPESTVQLSRVTNAEVFDFIEEDLAFAEANLEDQSEVTYVSQDFITAFRARMALYRENYTEAEAYADELIDDYTLTDINDYMYMFTDDIDGEVIFKLERTSGDSTISSLWFSVDATASGSPFYEMSRSLFNQLSENDIRYYTLVGTSSTIDDNYENSSDYLNSDILVINKYPGSEGINLLNDIKVFRVSEMYFIKAEAQIAAGDLTGAAETLQEVREARYADGAAPDMPTYANETAAWADVLAERRIELAYEGFRYTDLGRLGAKAQKQIDRDDMDCSLLSISSCTLPIDDYRFVLPIPASEIQANTAISDQQNPGY